MTDKLLYDICPKCQYDRQTDDQEDPNTCPGCELIFSKWMKQQFASPHAKTIPTTEYASVLDGIFTRVFNYVLQVEAKVNPFYFWGVP